MARQKATMTDMLKRVIADSGQTYTELERQTGVKRASIMRFVRGEQSLRLDLADKLADCFGLTVMKTKKRRQP